MKKYSSLSAAVVLASMLCSMVSKAAVAGEPTGPLLGFAAQRTWSDETGRFKIDAKLQFATEAEVKLLKPDGRVVTVPVPKLCKSDQAFVDGFLKAEAAINTVNSIGGDATDNPFAGGEPDSSSPAMSEAESGTLEPLQNETGTLEKREAIVKGARPISITPAKEFWSLPTLRPFPETDFEDLIIETQIEKPFFASMRVMAAGKQGNVVLNAYQQGRGNRENFGNFVLADAVSGDSSEVFSFDQPWKLLAITPDGSRLVAVRVEGFDKGNDLAIFRVVNGKVVPEFQFTAGGGSWDEIQYAAFLPQSRLVTISQKNQMTVWDLSSKVGVKAIRRGPSGGSQSAELSPAAEVMALLIGPSIAFVDTASFKLVGNIQCEERPSRLAFSNDGTRLATFTPFNVSLYDLASGQVSKSIAVAEGNANTSIQWVGKHLLVGSVLYDTEKGVPVWTYEARSTGQTTLGNHLFTAFGGDKGTTLTVFKIPHEDVLSVADDVDPSQIYSIIPGDSVSVDYALNNVPPAAQQQVRSAVEEKIKSLGWNLTSSAQNKIVIKIEPGKSDEAEYYTRTGFGPAPFFPPPGFGGPRPSGPSEKVSFVPWTHSISITCGGQSAFTATYVRGAPQSLSTKEGESTQAAVSRICQPSPDYFKNLALAPHLLKPEYQGGMGKSTIGSNGMR
jgi:WD40 repeat protein